MVTVALGIHTICTIVQMSRAFLLQRERHKDPQRLWHFPDYDESDIRRLRSRYGQSKGFNRTLSPSPVMGIHSPHPHPSWVVCDPLDKGKLPPSPSQLWTEGWLIRNIHTGTIRNRDLL